MKKRGWYLLALLLLCVAALLRPFAAEPAHTDAVLAAPLRADDTTLGVQAFLDTQPGVLKNHQEAGQSAAAIIEINSLTYGVSPYLHLALLETVNSLLSDPSPPDEALRQPYGAVNPQGFAAQIEWASRELRAGFGPYERPPAIQFTDGTTITLSLDQAPEGVAVQRFLARGRTGAEWRVLVDRFNQVFQDYFNNELPELIPPSLAESSVEVPTGGFLQCPWPMGMTVIHLAYFDHAYPTVDTGADGNNLVVTYAGPAQVQYNTHDGHDYVFPDNPIGTPILAAAPGIAYARTARGNGVVILHPGGYETVYWHLNHFAPRFRSVVDTAQGVWVETGDILGTSGTSGFRYGTPHLHFEVRHHGRQVDPYGWHGDGPDPCEQYAACVDRGWLWHSDLYGLYDFTPPDHLVSSEGARQAQAPPPAPDQTPPMGTLSLNPPDDLLLLARFEGHTLQQRGSGLPDPRGVVRFVGGRYGRALALDGESGLTYPISGNLRLEAGTISVWAHLPETYPDNGIQRHYLLAASANAHDDSGIYAGTLALRRDMLGPDGAPRWNFWTTPQTGEDGRDDLTAPDILSPGWHHLAITWDAASGSKALYLDGERAAATSGITLPLDIGPHLQLGRWSYGGSQGGFLFDELALFGHALSPAEVAAIARDTSPLSASASTITTTHLLLDINASDPESDGVIAAMQIGHNGTFADPQPYSDQATWELPRKEGLHTLSARYFDRASNRRVVSQTVLLDLPPVGAARMASYDNLGATLEVTATDMHPPLEMQISQSPDFTIDSTGTTGDWEALRPRIAWHWHTTSTTSTNTTHAATPSASAPLSTALVVADRACWFRQTGEGREDKPPPALFIRFRDSRGNISAPVQVAAAPARYARVYLPLIMR
jgi:murein DD-endopeptidase MepM/ murein hydrolase activator NlpD